MKSLKDLGIRQKFQLLVGTVFFLVGVFLFFYFPLKQKDEMSLALKEKAKVMAQMVAKTSSASLIFDEASSVTTLFEAFKEMKDVQFALVIRKDGSTFSAYNESKYKQYSSRISQTIKQNLKSYSDDDVEIELYSVLSENELVGNVIIGLNKADIHEFVANSRIAAFIISLIIFLGGLFGIRVFFNRVIYSPIKNLTSIADTLSTGDINVSIQSKTNDEIGRLEKAFISIVDSITDHTEVAESIAAGNLDKISNVKSGNDVLSKSMNKVIDTLRNLISEVSTLTKSAADGKLSERGTCYPYCQVSC